MITRTLSKNPRTTQGDIVNDLQRAGTKVTKATISNTTRRQGLKSCSARRVPLLKPVHVLARLKFAREHLDDPEEDWENVICDPEPPRNVRPSHPDPPLADGPTVPAHAEVCATEPSPAQEIGKDGTVWTVMEPCGGAGRRQIQNILTESAGPTPHARHNITDKLTAFMCLCDNVMLEEILDCTIAEARRDRATWDVSIMELKAFIALLYVRGAYCGKNIEMESFWSEQWGNAFFNATLSRNRFREIMRLGAVQELHEPGEHTEKGLHAPAGTRAAR
ncbi:hypothetical protein JOQ06_024211 [Pogonophryne albipinna]|uniref:Transposase Tc1-like domain-containing protein n=1 Tax=Pogonophryne albipinna TaxID=1090488 RepID=A0AAD6FSR8_9TELE|nr:hypothetical protein JOQ06_024211 [Pogonophryne albipinna]